MSSPWLSLLSPGGRLGRHQILIFHRVLPLPDPLLPGEPDRQAFDALIGMLKRRFNILPLPEALDRLDAGSLPPASLSITFDDGYADNATIAAPVLAGHGVSATFFVATGYLDGGRMWNDTLIETVRRLPDGELDLHDLGLGRYRLTGGNRAQVIRELITAVKHREGDERSALVQAVGARVSQLPGDLMMRSEQVRALADQGMTIGAHTVSHPILTRIDDDQARRELADGKAGLEALLGRAVTLFAYPNGKPGQDYAPRHARLAKELGFRAAVTTAPGVSGPETDRWQLPRFTPWDASHGRFTLRLLMNRHGLIR